MEYVFYYIKLSPSNILANFWLQTDIESNNLGHPCLAIYFGNRTAEELETLSRFGATFKQLCEVLKNSRKKVIFLTYTSDYRLVLSEPLPDSKWEMLDSALENPNSERKNAMLL